MNVLIATTNLATKLPINLPTKLFTAISPIISTPIISNIISPVSSPKITHQLLCKRHISKCIIIKNLPSELPSTFHSQLQDLGQVTSFSRIQQGKSSIGIVHFHSCDQAISAFEELDGFYIEKNRLFVEYAGEAQGQEVYNKAKDAKKKGGERDRQGWLQAGGVRKSNLGEGMWGDYKGKSVRNDVGAHFKYVEGMMEEGAPRATTWQGAGGKKWKKGKTRAGEG